MIDNSTLEKWTTRYTAQRVAGASGWADADSYRRNVTAAVKRTLIGRFERSSETGLEPQNIES